ncbi:MAG TPA: C39 family peptidase, partial [Vicinamibacterales bacterium]
MNRSPHTSTACVAVVLVCVALSVPANAQPASPPLSILDVPFISQSEALCGGAAAAMVLRYWGARGLDAESFASLVDRGAGGIRTNRLVEDLRRRGWNAVEVEGREDLVEAELGRGRPVLALIEDRPGTFHYIVIVAATPHAIVLHDPARTPFRVMEREQFARRWSRADRWMAVVTPIESSRSSAPPAPVAATEGS